MVRYSRSRRTIYAGGASGFQGNGLYYYSEKAVSEEVRKVVSMSPDEYLASLPVNRRCAVQAKFYDLVVRTDGVDSDEAINVKRDLAKCPENFSKVVEEIDNFGLKPNQISEEVRKVVSMSPDEYLASLPIDRRCAVQAKFYQMVVRTQGVNSDDAIDVKRDLAKCPEKFSKVVEEIDNSGSKLSNEST